MPRIEKSASLFYNLIEHYMYSLNFLNLNFQKGRGNRPGWPHGEAFPWRGCFH